MFESLPGLDGCVKYLHVRSVPRVGASESGIQPCAISSGAQNESVVLFDKVRGRADVKKKGRSLEPILVLLLLIKGWCR